MVYRRSSFLFSISQRGHPSCLSCRKTLTVQEVDHQLVGAHHDRCVGDLADQMCGETPVQGAVALFFGHCCQSLEKRAVFGAFFS